MRISFGYPARAYIDRLAPPNDETNSHNEIWAPQDALGRRVPKETFKSLTKPSKQDSFFDALVTEKGKRRRDGNQIERRRRRGVKTSHKSGISIQEVAFSQSEK